MDVFGWSLLVWAVGSLVFLTGVEAAMVVTGKPTISARIQALGRSASIVVIWAMFVAGYLASHFFEVR